MLHQTEAMVQARSTFSDIMARRLQRASQSGGVLEPAPEVFEIAETIEKHVQAMSIHVETMLSGLGELTRTLEETKQKNDSLKSRILRWLARAFAALSCVFSLAAPVTAVLSPLATPFLAVGSLILSAASEVASTISRDRHGECMPTS